MGKSHFRGSVAKEKTAAIAAYLASDYKGRTALKVGQIQKLNLPGLTSQPAVTRALAEAKRLELIRFPDPELLEEGLRKHELLEYVLEFEDQGHLRDLVRKVAIEQKWPHVPTVHRIPVRAPFNRDKMLEGEYQRQMNAFFRLAALVVSEQIARCKHVGVSWGQTLENLVRALEQDPPPTTSVDMVIPLVGDPPAGETSAFSSNLLAERLHRALHPNSAKAQRFSLRFVHSFVSDAIVQWHLGRAPKNAQDVQRGLRKAIDYYCEVSSYRDIFIGPGGGTPAPRARTHALVETLDAVVTSLSPDDRPWGLTPEHPWSPTKSARRSRTYILNHDDQIIKRVQQVAVGDICGVLLPRHKSPEATLELQRLQERWTGIKIEHLLHLAAAAAKNPATKAGVVVVAFGSPKLQTTTAALQLGLINHLVVGEELAGALAKHLESVLSGESA